MLVLDAYAEHMGNMALYSFERDCVAMSLNQYKNHNM